MIELNDANFAQETSEGIVLVDFWSPWCAPCRMQGPILEEIATEVEGRVRVGKVNVNEDRLIATEFGIRGIPTLVILKNGRLVRQFIGLTPKRELMSAIESVVEEENNGESNSN